MPLAWRDGGIRAYQNHHSQVPVAIASRESITANCHLTVEFLSFCRRNWLPLINRKQQQPNNSKAPLVKKPSEKNIRVSVESVLRACERLFITFDVSPSADTAEARRGAGRAASAARWQPRHRGAVVTIPHQHCASAGRRRGLWAGWGGRAGAAAAHEAHPGAAPDCQRTARIYQGRQGELGQFGEFLSRSGISKDFPRGVKQGGSFVREIFQVVIRARYTPWNIWRTKLLKARIDKY